MFICKLASQRRLLIHIFYSHPGAQVLKKMLLCSLARNAQIIKINIHVWPNKKRGGRFFQGRCEGVWIGGKGLSKVKLPSGASYWCASNKGYQYGFCFEMDACLWVVARKQSGFFVHKM
jgi:hypothetical protein